ncbi:MAG: hypothetical protein KA270_06870 [Saprospiraceae bacterium]|nr:hypothetical protein [Saprospiraceae bacterium]MBP6566871.1 hypothetical protein [Saprospiraceae bacterium]
MDIYNISEIEIELRALSDAACGNGISALLDSKKISIEEFIEHKEKYAEDFIRFSHDGFKEAQNGIIKNILLIQDEQEVIKQNLKRARVERNIEEIPELINKQKHLENIVKLFKHCADTLVWQLIKGQLWISRRLYLNVSGGKKLKEVNLESAIKVAEDYNSNPMNFVLITDITNNVQVGDLIGIVDGQVIVVEIKEGEKNLRILEVIQQLNKPENKHQDILRDISSEPKMIEQFERTLKQHKTLHDVHQILNTDKGIDPTSGKEIRIFTPNEPTPLYSERLSFLEKQLQERNFWAYDVIEDCLHIGIYKGKKRFGGHLILKAICDQKEKPNYIIIDALSIIDSLNKPLFFLPFSPDFIFDIIFSRIKMYFMLDLDSYMELYSHYGFNAEWASRKETTKEKELAKGYDILEHNHRGIKIKIDGDKDMWLSTGTLTRIFFEHINPSYTAYSTKYYIEK